MLVNYDIFSVIFNFILRKDINATPYTCHVNALPIYAFVIRVNCTCAYSYVRYKNIISINFVRLQDSTITEVF